MSFFSKVMLVFILIGTAFLAAYLFVWFLIFVIIVSPIAYLWWRWQWHRMKKEMQNGKVIVVKRFTNIH